MYVSVSLLLFVSNRPFAPNSESQKKNRNGEAEMRYARMEGSPSEIMRPGPDSLTADKPFYLCHPQFQPNRMEKTNI